MKKGETVLIHSGTGGIGQAAIRLALCYGCKVFTTVGNQEKRDFLKKLFPQLEQENISNSHGESFEQLIYSRTNGRGVDLVLNSLAEEKLITSVRCLARGGRFIEIGKFDLANNHHINALLLEKDASFHGVMLDEFFRNTSQVKRMLSKLITNFIKYGVIKPLNRTIFKFDEVEQAFRFMASGKHKGKVLIQIRKPDKEIFAPPSVIKLCCIPRFNCDADNVYVILGGLGGFGLELVDWLILRGAKKLVLTSRKGLTTGYQNYRLSIWKKYNITVKVTTTPISTKEGCKQLIKECLELGSINGIFNLAAVLADAVFKNQTNKTFTTSFEPKAYATEYLDEITREMCPDLRHFVVFSSISCGRGNAGQTNYGMANSVMERICENRKREGYPALAVQWGPIGDVGLVAEMENKKIEIQGMVQQRISNCLQALDLFLGQTEVSVVSSMIVGKKHALNAEDNIVNAVIGVLGVTNSNLVSHHLTLSEIGMDSIMAIEIKQILETEFEVFLSAKDIRTLTLAKLKDIQNNKSTATPIKNKNMTNFDVGTVFRLIGDKEQSNLPFIELPSGTPPNPNAPTLIMFGGLEGLATIFHEFAKHICARTVAVQLDLHDDENTIPEIAKSVIPVVEKFVFNNHFALLGYSFGTVIVLEVASILESLGYNGTVILIDGSPLFVKHIINFNTESDNEFETELLCRMMSFFMGAKQIEQLKENIFNCVTWEKKLDLGIDIIQQHIKKDMGYEKLVANNIYRRIKAASIYSPSYSKLRAKIKLIKPTQVTVADLPEDYGLSEYLTNPAEVYTLEGNHETILENETVGGMASEFLHLEFEIP